MVISIMLKVMCLATLVTLCQGQGQGQDSTMTRGAAGAAIVDAVIDRIRSYCIFSEDRLFLRRTAYVMSRDGQDSATYRAGFHGGIWQINETMFQATQNCNQQYIRTACSHVSSVLNISWTSANWADLRKPLYSGVAAALSALLTLGSTDMPGDVPSQASWWSIMYSRPMDTFITEAVQTPVFTCSDKLDLAFILDSSGSVSSSDFNLMKDFASKVVDVMSISSDGVRIADIVYASTVQVFFDFDDFFTKAAVKSQLLSTGKINTGTNTASALDQARHMLYDYSRSGARKDVKKVAVLVTDGISNSFSSTNKSAALLKAEGTTVFAVGVGGYNLAELQAVASNPICSHVMTLTGFDKIAAIITEIQKSTCQANYKVAGNGTISRGIPENGTEENFEIKTPDNNKTIVTKAPCGILNIYASVTDTKPGPAVFDERYTATPEVPAVLRIVETLSPGTPVYVTVVGTRLPASAAALRNCSDYNWTLSKDDKEDIKVICEVNGVRRACTEEDIIHAGLCSKDDYLDYPVDNPCTPENLGNGILRHSYPYDPTKFLQCDLQGNYYITLCPRGVIFNTQTRECGFAVPGSPTAESNNGGPYNCKASGDFAPVPTVTVPSNGQTSPATAAPSGVNAPCTSEALARNEFYHAYGPDETKFIQCDVWGNTYVMSCRPDTVWSQSEYTCVHARTPAARTAGSAPPCTHGQLTPDECDHHKFNICDNGNLTSMDCPAGLHFSPALGDCDWAPATPAPYPASCP